MSQFIVQGQGGFAAVLPTQTGVRQRPLFATDTLGWYYERQRENEHCEETGTPRVNVEIRTEFEESGAQKYSAEEPRVNIDTPDERYREVDLHCPSPPQQPQTRKQQTQRQEQYVRRQGQNDRQQTQKSKSRQPTRKPRKSSKRANEILQEEEQLKDLNDSLSPENTSKVHRRRRQSADSQRRRNWQRNRNRKRDRNFSNGNTRKICLPLAHTGIAGRMPHLPVVHHIKDWPLTPEPLASPPTHGKIMHDNNIIINLHTQENMGDNLS